jgi:hypothetical protein
MYNDRGTTNTADLAPLAGIHLQSEILKFCMAIGIRRILGLQNAGDVSRCY